MLDNANDTPIDKKGILLLPSLVGYFSTCILYEYRAFQ